MTAIWHAIEQRSATPGAIDLYNYGQEPGIVFFRNQSPDPAMLMSVFVNQQKQASNVPIHEECALQLLTNETVQVSFLAGPPGSVASYVVGRGCK